MRRIACFLTLAALCLWLPAASSRAGNGWHGGGWHGGGWHGGGWHGGTRVVVGFGPGWGWGGPGWGWGPGWAWGYGGYGYGPGWYPSPYAYPQAVIQQQPQQYIEQPVQQQQPGDGYWYYCQSAGGYYPRVPNCAEPWVKVPPVPE